MLEVTIAKAWGLKPSEFKKLLDEDKAYMTAFEEVNAQISATDAFIADERAKEAERKAGRKKPGGYSRRR
jgi:hypothetical protein